MSVPVQIWLGPPNKNNMKQLIKSNAPIIITLLAILGWLVLIYVGIERQSAKATIEKTKDEVIDSLENRIKYLEQKPMFINFYITKDSI